MNKWSSPRIDPRIAQDMLDDGTSVRDVAHRFGVSTQAVYKALKHGRLDFELTRGPHKSKGGSS